MTKTYNFEKRGINFYFRNPSMDKYGDLVFEYKIPSYIENDINEGFYYNSKYIQSQGVIQTVSKINIDGKGYNMFKLPDDINKEFNSIYIELKSKRDELIDKIVNEIVSGKRNITFSIVGCDYPHYQAWVKLPKELDGQEQKIMEKAIIQIIGKDEYISNPCTYLGTNKLPATLEQLGDVLNPKFDKESQEYHGFKDDIVTNYELPIMTILQPKIDKKQKKANTIEVIFKKAKETGERQLLRKWTEDCNDEDEDCDIDDVCEYAMPDGTTKIERYHNW